MLSRRTKFTKGPWRHRRMVDVFVDIIKIQYVGEKYTKLKVIWMNRGYTGKPWMLTMPENVKVMREDEKDWIRK